MELSTNKFLPRYSEVILFIDKSNMHAYFNSASYTFTSKDLTLCSPAFYLDFSWRVGPDSCGSDHFPLILEKGGPERFQR